MKKLQRRLQGFDGESLCNLKLSSVRQVHQSAVETSRIHDALQSRYDDLFFESARGDEDKIAAETSKDQDIQASHYEIIDKAVEWVERLSFYQKGTILSDSLHSILELAPISTPALLSEIDNLKSKVSEYQTSTLDYASDEALSVLRRDLQDSVQQINARLADEHSRTPSKGPTTAMEMPAPVKTHGIKLKAPTFSGKPTDWITFNSLFTSMIERQSHLSDTERCCLLLDSMTTDEAKDIVTHHYEGDGSYDAAMAALAKHYGQPQQIYPLHVRALLSPEKYTYTRTSLQNLRNTFTSHRRAMQRLNGWTADHIMAVVLLDRLDSRLKAEWTRHDAARGKSDMPKLDELLALFESHEQRMDADKIDSSKSSSKLNFKSAP